jgi:hypothetical protein
MGYGVGCSCGREGMLTFCRKFEVDCFTLQCVIE